MYFYNHFSKFYTPCVVCGRKVRSKYPFQIICDECFEEELDRLD